MNEQRMGGLGRSVRVAFCLGLYASVLGALSANPAGAQVARTIVGPAVGSDAAGAASPQTITFSAGPSPLAVGERVIASVAIRGGGNATGVTISDGTNNLALTLDQGPVSNLGGGGNSITVAMFSAAVTSAFTPTRYIVTHTGTVNRVAVQAASYTGLTRIAAAVDSFGTNTQGPVTSATAASSALDTTRPNTRLITVVAGDRRTGAAPTYTGVTFSLADARSITAPTTTLFLGSAEATVSSATVTYNATVAPLTANTRTASILAAYRIVPSKIEVSPSTSTLDSGVCTVVPFTFTTKTTDGIAIPPINGTTITVTSGNSGAQVRIGSCPDGSQTNVDSIVLDDATSSFDVYVTDTTAGSGVTLTATGNSGGDNLTNAVATYSVNAAAATGYCIIYPGQTFVDGQCSAGGFCIVDEAPTPQVAGTSFSATVIAHDASCNRAAPLTSTINVVWDGYTKLGGDGSQALEPSPLTFDSNQEAAITLRMVVAEDISPFFTDDGALFGYQVANASEDPHTLSITMPANTTTLVITNPNAVTATRTGYSARSNGEIEIRVTNGTGGGINRVEIEDPGSMGDWASASSAVWNSTGTTQIVTGWTLSLQGSTLRFQASSSSTFPSGTSLRFRARLSTGVYPNLSSPSTFSQTVRYEGFQSCTSASCLGASPLNQFTVRPPLNPVLLPTVVRSSSLTNPRFNWTNTDSAPPSRAGVIVVRGTATPADTRAYTLGEEVAAGSRVVCVVSGSGTTCDDSPGGGNDLPDATTASYRVYQFDSFNGYSSGTALSVPAKPATGYAYRHTGTGLGEAAAPQNNEAGGGAAPNASPGYVVFTSNSNNGIYFVRNDGTEQRRPTTTVAPIAKRASVPRLSSSAYEVFAADNGTRAYRVLPGTNGAPSQVTLGSPVSAGPTTLSSNTLTALNTAFNGDAVLFATNGASANFVRGYRPSLTISPWQFNLTDTTDGVSADSYIYINNAASQGIMMVPAGFGTGGIYGIDLVNYNGGASPQPSGWPGTKVFSGTRFRAQCRKFISTANVVCGDVSGNLYAINPVTGAQVGSTFNTGSQSILAVVPAVGQTMVYVTRSPDGTTNARVGRVTFNGSTFTSNWNVTVSGVPVLSGPLVLESQNAIFVSGDANATAGTGGSVVRLNATTGAVLATNALDGDDVSDPVYVTTNDNIIVQTDNGTIWAKPRSSL